MTTLNRCMRYKMGKNQVVLVEMGMKDPNTPVAWVQNQWFWEETEGYKIKTIVWNSENRCKCFELRKCKELCPKQHVVRQVLTFSLDDAAGLPFCGGTWIERSRLDNDDKLNLHPYPAHGVLAIVDGMIMSPPNSLHHPPKVLYWEMGPLRSN